MKELTLNGRTYLSTKRAAEITGYTTDYVGQLARGEKIDAQLVGRNWYISEESIKKHKFGEAQVSIKEEDETPATQLEVLVSSAEEAVEDDRESSVAEDVLINKTEDVPPTEDVLDEMQGAWQEWYKAQRSIPAEEEVFLKKEDVIPIQKEEVVESVVAEEEVEEIEEPVEVAPTPTPVTDSLPAQRSWAGTGLVLAAVLAIVFVGALTAATGYVLTKHTDSPVATAFEGARDYVLGIQRIERK